MSDATTVETLPDSEYNESDREHYDEALADVYLLILAVDPDRENAHDSSLELHAV